VLRTGTTAKEAWVNPVGGHICCSREVWRQSESHRQPVAALGQPPACVRLLGAQKAHLPLSKVRWTVCPPSPETRPEAHCALWAPPSPETP
jgi:hypothetical protein